MTLQGKSMVKHETTPYFGESLYILSLQFSGLYLPVNSSKVYFKVVLVAVVHQAAWPE